MEASEPSESARRKMASRVQAVPPPPTPPSVRQPSPALGDEIRAVARKLANHPIENPDPGVWAVLTAISKNARLRSQGMNIILSADEHVLGRCVEDSRFQISGNQISGLQCRIFRDTLAGEMHPESPVPVFIKDTSTNGTYLNRRRLRKHSPQAALTHGDIIAFVVPPHDENSYAFVYREVHPVLSPEIGGPLKRKSDGIDADNKRLKGIGIGSPDGPVSLDDVRSLERSNTELRQQLESHVMTVQNLTSEIHSSTVRHENELKELRETVSTSYADQIRDLKMALDGKQKELDSLNSSFMEIQNSMKDLTERHDASKQSCAEAELVIVSQKMTISELKEQLEEERSLKREEREKAAADLKAALHRAQTEAEEEIRRQGDAFLRQHKEQQDLINKLQESEQDCRLLVETLRAKLENAREGLVLSEKKVRQLEVHLQDERLDCVNSKKKCDALESELMTLKNELEKEKAAREEAWAKVSSLEMQIAAAIRDLSMEKQRIQGARERIILRETQLRAFYSTTEEISALFSKQQEQLKAMQKTLEDEENYEHSLVGFDLNGTPRNSSSMNTVEREAQAAQTNRSTKETYGSSPNDVLGGRDHLQQESASGTEKHECLESQDGDTLDMECTSVDKSAKGFGSQIDGVGTAVFTEKEFGETERIPETESLPVYAGCDEQNTMKKYNALAGGDTMQLDDDQQGANLAPAKELDYGVGECPESRVDDSENGTIRTADLLASENAGSWAVSTAPSVNGENESPGSSEDDGDEQKDATPKPVTDPVACLDGIAAGSQSNDVNEADRLNGEKQALNDMIDILDPDFRRNLPGCAAGLKYDSLSDAETEEEENDHDSENSEVKDGTEAIIEDSVG